MVWGFGLSKQGDRPAPALWKDFQMEFFTVCLLLAASARTKPENLPPALQEAVGDMTWPSGHELKNSDSLVNTWGTINVWTRGFQSLWWVYVCLLIMSIGKKLIFQVKYVWMDLKAAPKCNFENLPQNCLIMCRLPRVIFSIRRNQIELLFKVWI